MNEALSTPPPGKDNDRWTFLRDVLVFQLKLFVDNVRDFLLAPVSLGAAVIDLIFKGEREGALFYKVLRWGSHSEQIIDVYSAIERQSPSQDGGFSVKPGYTIDGVIARLEGVLARECEKGGTAASVKAAMDRAFDELHAGTSGARDRATNLVTRAADKVRGRFETEQEK
jgi:hypothetical protein